MMRRLQRPWEDWLALAMALPVVLGSRAAITVVPYRWWRSAMMPTTVGRDNASLRLTPARIGWAVAAAARFVPDATCLTQALAVRALLRLAGYPSTLTIGVRKGEFDRPDAHAWVHSGTEPVVGVPAEGAFQVMERRLDGALPQSRQAMGVLLRALGDPTSGQPGLPAAVWELARTHQVDEMLRRRFGTLVSGAQEERARTGQTLGLIAQLVHVHDMLDHEGIRVLALKGPWLSLLLYGDASVRRSVDVDLLVALDDAERVRRLLEGAGYTDPMGPQPRERQQMIRRWGCEWQFVSTQSHVHVEVHWRLSPRQFAFEAPFASLWERREGVVVAGRSVAGLGREDLVLFLCVHGAKHLWSRLLWLVDLATLVQQTPGMDWIAVMERSQKWHCRRRVAVGLALAERCLGVELPAEIRAWIGRERRAVSLSDHLYRRLLSGSTAPLPWIQGQRLQLSLLDGARDRVRYSVSLAEAMATPSANDLRWAPLPASLSRLYYVLRPVRIAVKYTRAGAE